MHADIIKLTNLHDELIGQDSLDVMFIIDCTGSMQKWIDQCKKDVRSIIETIREKNPANIKIRISVIGYRDHSDLERIECLPFT